MTGQICLADYIQDRDNVTFKLCSQCACRGCLYWWSQRCHYGECWDDRRAEIEPYGKAHPVDPQRDGWSDWGKLGEQAHWCRGGIFYPVHYCPEFVNIRDSRSRSA